jgi:tyrosyl-tRNA synthetase
MQTATASKKNHIALPEVLTRGVAEILPGTQTLAELISKQKIRLYLGIDPTGAFLTLGHSVVLRKLQQFAELGHDVILLIGNGTVRIGDPTGRDTTRPVLTDQQIQENFKNWQSQAGKILDFSKIHILHNGDWLDKLTYADMVKLMAQTTIQQLTERDMFQERMKNGQPIFGHEIMYPLLQGYDSVAMNVDLEVGGTDQTFNMMMGRHLQKVYNNHQKWVLTTPIINGTDGRKMSKSYGNYVALTDAPTDMYGKLMSIADEMIVEYFTLLTNESLAEIEKIRAAMAAGENPMQFKKRLAHEITQMYHTAAEANAAQAHFEKTVQEKQVPDSADMEKVMIKNEEGEQGKMKVIEVLKRCLPQESTSNLKRLIEQKAVEIFPGGERPSDINAEIAIEKIETIRVGKRKYFQIV